MAMYLLLRSNKEQGPYTLEQLIQLGLKPYDLVWIEGRSAAWRYPSEIPELKPYAPEVEEQPFDRFFKKSSSQQETEIIAEKKEQVLAPAISKNKTEKEEIAEQPQSVKILQTKNVFVSLPSNGSKKTIIPAEKEKSEKKETPVVKQIIPPLPEKEKAEPVLETKYSQSLDEIKDLYTQTLLDRKKKISRNKLLQEWWPRAAVILFVLLAGIFVGGKLTGKKPAPQIVEKVVVPSPPVAVEKEPEIPANQQDQGTDILTDKTEEEIPNEPATLNMDNQTAISLPAVKEKKETQKKKTSIAGAPLPPPVTEADNYEEERNKVVRAEQPVVKTISKEELLKKVSVSANKYKQAAFGGIKNLELTVTNSSPYILDNVVVEIQYLKPSEEPLKTEMIRFSSVAPNGSLTIRVPDYNRGVKLVYKIIRVESKELNGLTAGL